MGNGIEMQNLGLDEIEMRPERLKVDDFEDGEILNVKFLRGEPTKTKWGIRVDFTVEYDGEEIDISSWNIKVPKALKVSSLIETTRSLKVNQDKKKFVLLP